jgi:Protein of unknown function (DUF938)
MNGNGAGRSRFNETLPPGVLESPAAERNKQPILERLTPILPRGATVLEIASGTGQHVTYFAAALPDLTWQPSEPDPELLQSVRHRLAAAPLTNVLEPVRLDVTQGVWPVGAVDAVLCSNMIHIAPWTAAQGLLAGAEKVVSRGGLLILYGPFKRAGEHTSPSNAEFDVSLRSRDPAWGVRDLDDVGELALMHGFALEAVYEMPANNLLVVFRRDPPDP